MYNGRDMKIIEAIKNLFGPRCLCTKVCDCQDPEGKATDGQVKMISNGCPIHNDIPQPDPDCPVHGKLW